MDAHERFMTHYTPEVWVLLRKVSVYDVALTTVVESFNQVIQNFDRVGYDISLMYVKTVHTVLCSFYKHKVTRKETPGGVIIRKLDHELNSKAFEQINISGIQDVIYTVELKAEILSLVLDILVLQLVLYHDVHRILQHLGELQKSISLHLVQDREIKILDLKLLDCYMDSILLLQRSPGNSTVPQLTSIGKVLLRDVSLWLKLKNWKCQLSTLLLPKVIIVLNQNESLTNTWEAVFTLQDDPGETLSILCLTIDIWFPMESEYDEQLINQAMKEPFWLFLLQGLSSSIPQQRKHALYLIKSIVNFANARKTQILELENYKEVRPLICKGNDSEQNSFKKNLKNFYLIFETLEEKEENLVQPVFPLLKNLVKETFEQENRETCFHIAWIRCAFLRILHHDNNDVVKQGLSNVLIVDLQLYNDDFLNKVLNVLNTTYLYENNSSEGEPTVVKELIIFLNYAETMNSDFIARFIVKTSEITWDPVPLFYIIHVLSMVRRVLSIWREVELKTVKSLAEITLTMDCRILRIGSQIELLEAMTHFAVETLDLVAVANVLSVFSTNEALIRGQLAWKRTSTWLSKTITEDEALSFLDKMMNENSCKDLSVKLYALMIMLFYDAHLILKSEFCPSLTTLRNLLDCLHESKSKTSASPVSRNISIELIYHFLDFTSSKDFILRELIADYADASLRFIFKNLRNASGKTLVDNINTYVLVTQKLLTAESSIIAKTVVHNYMERFEIESLNIIEDGEYSNNIQRYFGIKILHTCLKTMSLKCRNYKFIGSLYKTHRIPMIKSSKDADEANKTVNKDENLKDKVVEEYYKFVAELFYEYVEDVSVDEWIPDIDWIEQVSYFIEVGGNDIFVPVVGILTQIFYKGAVKASDLDKFKTIMRLCWSSTLISHLVTKEIIDLIFSSPFLECKATKELTIEFTREMVEKDDQIPGLRIILLKGLKHVKYLSNFYEAILPCLLHGTVLCGDRKIEIQARSYVLESYQDVYPNYLSNVTVNTNVATRAHAITLLHKMITDDPAHAAALLPSIITKLNESQNKTYLQNSQIHRIKNQIMQVLLLLQPILENHEIESSHTLMCNELMSGSNQPSVRIMQEWLLIRIYLESETLRAKIWDLIDQGQDNYSESLCSVFTVVYHVARFLSDDLQLDFINLAFQYIMPCCMTQELNVRLHAQVIASKLYDLAIELSYSTITEEFSKFYMALTKSLKHRNPMNNSAKLQDDFDFTVFNPIEDYSLETLFYELPKLSNVSSVEYILPQMYEEFGFKESNSHPLKLLNLHDDVTHTSNSSESAEPVENYIIGRADCSSDDA